MHTPSVHPMTRAQAQYEQHREYIEREGLDALMDFRASSDYGHRAFDAVRSYGAAMPPLADDLVTIHRLIRERLAFTVLEFGVGYSTLVIADALAKNAREWAALPHAPEIRNRFLFQCFSTDASAHWVAETERRMPPPLRERVQFSVSSVTIGTFNGQLCHYYDTLPDVVPDFIYLDGPHPKDVQGTVRGMSFQCEERTVMAADLLTMESTLLPSTCIVVDGRTNNARFLARNFTRPWDVQWDRAGDRTVFTLTEERLGKYNILGTDIRMR